MLNLAAHRKDKTVAFIAAFVLLLQTLLASWSASADAMALDAFGNPLCITSSDGGSTPGDVPAKIPNCCTLGCSMSSTVLAGPVPEHPVVIPVTGEYAGAVIAQEAPRHARRDHGPGSPRAPPLST